MLSHWRNKTKARPRKHCNFWSIFPNLLVLEPNFCSSKLLALGTCLSNLGLIDSTLKSIETHSLVDYSPPLFSMFRYYSPITHT